MPSLSSRNSRESIQIGCSLFEHHWSNIRIRSGSMHQLQQTYMWFQARKKIRKPPTSEASEGHCNSGRPANSEFTLRLTIKPVTDLWQAGSIYDPTMARLPLADILHRGVVYSLVGLSVGCMVMAVFVHRDTMQRGRGVWQNCTPCPTANVTHLPSQQT